MERTKEEDMIIKVYFPDCDKKELLVRKGFAKEWDDLVEELKKKYREKLKDIVLVSK